MGGNEERIMNDLVLAILFYVLTYILINKAFSMFKKRQNLTGYSLVVGASITFIGGIGFMSLYVDKLFF